jgi:hypothetical protein
MFNHILSYLLIIPIITSWMRSIAPTLLAAAFLLLVTELMVLLRLGLQLIQEFDFG